MTVLPSAAVIAEALAREPLIVGRSKALYALDEQHCIIRLIPSLTSFTYGREELVPGTEILRLDFYELAAQSLAKAGITTAFRGRLGTDLYYADLCADLCQELPFEVIVKNKAVGSTLRKYPGLFEPNHCFNKPVVKFDYRIDPEDQPIAEDYLRESGCDPELFKAIALRVNEELQRWLTPRILLDFCIVIGRHPSGHYAITSEISPDCMRLQNEVGQSLDKDLFRQGASHQNIRSVWADLVHSLQESL
jgi:phosphoribosylaminoimidazole-succinocarboxamide synthase